MASGSINIRRDVDYEFYRYRMPILTTKTEGKGKDTKTVVSNMSDVARALNRPPIYIMKFFGCEFGAQTTFDEKNEKYIINGARNANRLRELLDVFIEKFVLCKSCRNPDTELVILESDRIEDIIRVCKTCGERTEVDMRHKLTTFIVKNPLIKTQKGKNKNAGDENSESLQDDGNENDDYLTKKIMAEAAELNTETTLDKEDWSADTSPEAVKRRAKALEGSSAAIRQVGDDDEEAENDDANSPYSALGRWIKENPENDTKVLSLAIYKKAEELGIDKKHKTVAILVQALFTENIVSEVDNYGALLTKLVTSEKHQKALLGGVERFIGLIHPDLTSTVPKILMALYQIDLIDEEVVTQWGTHVSQKYVDRGISKKVRKASEPFLKWLKDDIYEAQKFSEPELKQDFKNQTKEYSTPHSEERYNLAKSELLQREKIPPRRRGKNGRSQPVNSYSSSSNTSTSNSYPFDSVKPPPHFCCVLCGQRGHTVISHANDTSPAKGTDGRPTWATYSADHRLRAPNGRGICIGFNIIGNRATCTHPKQGYAHICSFCGQTHYAFSWICRDRPPHA